MHTSIVTFTGKRSKALSQFPRLAEKRSELTHRAQGATLAALTALEHTYGTFPESGRVFAPTFQYLERIGFFFEKVGGLEVLRLQGEKLIEKGGNIYVEESSSLKSLLEFRGLFEGHLKTTLQDVWELWNVSPVGYHTLNRDGIILTVNETEARILGYQPKEMVGRSIFDFILSSQQNEARRRFLDKLQGRDVPPTQDRIYLHRDGSEINMSAEDLLARDDQGQVVGVKTVLIDISKMRRLQEQLYQLKKKEDLGELAKGVAHEFNNLLCSIQIAIQTLRKILPQDSEDAEQLCRLIVEDCAKGKNITDAVLHYAQLKKFYPEAINPEPIVRNIFKIFSNQSQPPIKYRVENGNKSLVWGGEHQVYQAVMNLISNAVDSMPKGGTIRVDLRDLSLPADYRTTCGLLLHRGNYVVMEVLDSGHGIPEEVIPKVFDPFFTTKSPATSTGLGLSTVLGIMESHNGGIDIRSKLGKGTEVTLFFPAFSLT